MKVKIVDYGYSKDFGKYYITYQIKELDTDQLAKLQLRLEDPLLLKRDQLYLTTHFEAEFYPLGSPEAKKKMEDYISREEIEMTAYILELLDSN
ncbi:MAG TPA: DUF5750 family protein [Methanobacteriaceae archaeon]|nr:DUF5750 family protein [Methanobacteriaceae archaeon]